MELGIYDIIKGTVITPKSMLLRKKFGTITFKVNKLANKGMVREAVEKIWDVKVDDIKIINIAGKSRIIKKVKHKRPDTKKALVSLKSGYKIDLPEQFETMGMPEAEPNSKG